MRQPAVFRIVVLSAAVLAAAAPIVDLVAPTIVFALGRTPVGTHPPDGMSPIVAAAGVTTLICYGLGLVSALGLLFLRRWARPLAVAVPVALMLAHLPIGEMSYSGVAFAMALASYGLWGWALSMAYFSELKNDFV